jgi:hypothetical protein
MLRDHLEAKRAFFNHDKPKFMDELAKNAPRTYPWWTELVVDRRPQAANVPGSKL